METIQEFKAAVEQFRETGECGMLVCWRSRENGLNYEERSQIERCINGLFAQVFQVMKQEASALSDSDLIYCVLVQMGFDNAVISDCLAISKDSLRMRKMRVREKLSDQWNAFIFSDVQNCNGNVAQHSAVAATQPITLPENETQDMEKITFWKGVGMGFRRMFRFKGRASRREFWYYELFLLILFNVLLLIYFLSTVLFAHFSSPTITNF